MEREGERLSVQVEEAWRDVAVFFMLRLALAPCVESLVLVDRTLFLSEQGTVEPPNNEHVGDQHFVHCSEVVDSSECPLSEVPLLIHTHRTHKKSSVLGLRCQWGGFPLGLPFPDQCHGTPLYTPRF